MTRSFIFGASALVHVGMVVVVGEIRGPKVVETTAIEVQDISPPPPPAPESPPAEAAPEPAPTPAPLPKPAARAEAPPAAAAADPSPAPPPDAPSVANLPDLGVELSGGTGAGGIAVPGGTGGGGLGTGSGKGQVRKTLAATPEKEKPTDTCTDGPAKPKLLDLPKPAHTEAARAAGIEGKVRVEITVDERGAVVSVRVLAGLGYGLDEAAVAAAKGATFEPAMRCGKPSRSTFTIAVRFAAP